MLQYHKPTNTGSNNQTSKLKQGQKLQHFTFYTIKLKKKKKNASALFQPEQDELK